MHGRINRTPIGSKQLSVGQPARSGQVAGPNGAPSYRVPGANPLPEADLASLLSTHPATIKEPVPVIGHYFRSLGSSWLSSIGSGNRMVVFWVLDNSERERNIRTVNAPGLLVSILAALANSSAAWRSP